MGETQSCGTCRWHDFDTDGKDWACFNEPSDSFGDWTTYSHTCDEWEGRS